MADDKLREDLYCPECAHKGMRREADKAQSGKNRYRCQSCGHRTTSLLYSEPQLLPAFKTESIRTKKRFIITSAVNDCPLVIGAHRVFESMSKQLNAAYMIIPGFYKNPDLKSQGVNHSYTWPAEIIPYVCDADVKLCDSLYLRGRTRIRYTTVNPLAGLNHAGDALSEIFGHPQIAMEMVPTPKNEIPKMLITTGSISQKRYGTSKRSQNQGESYTAKKAEFHHSIGALLVEIEDGKFWTTQLRYDGEGVMLYDKYYTVKGAKKHDGVSGIVYGDIHARAVTKETRKRIKHMEKKLTPNEQVFHDVHDHHIGSHHTQGNKLFALGKNATKEFSIREELMMSVDFLDGRIAPVVVDSNHDRHLDQWFNRFKPALDHVNIDLYYELGEMARLSDGTKGLFQLFIEKHMEGVVFTNPNDMYLIEGIDVGQHGDKGPNGARGSAKAFAKTGYKTVIGHSHCLTGDHDVLTPGGWVSIAEASKNTPILSWKDGKNVWELPESKSVNLYTGKLVKIHKRGCFTQEVTDNHELMLSDGSKIPVCQAILTRKAAEIPISAVSEDSDIIDVDETLLRKIVAVCADGSFYKNSLVFNVKKKRKIERLKMLFGDDIREPGKSNEQTGAVKMSVKMDSNSYRQISQYIETNTESKRLPEMFVYLNNRCKEIVFDELTKWDGTFKTENNGRQFSTYKECEANLVSTMLTICGYRNTMKKRSDSRGYIISWCTNKEHIFSTSLDHDKARINNWGVTTRNVVDEPVYCFTLETGCFWIRNRTTGLISLTGNSPRIEKGCYQVGTSSMDMDYAKGYSSWFMMDCIIYSNGKRGMVSTVAGKLPPLMRAA